MRNGSHVFRCGCEGKEFTLGQFAEWNKRPASEVFSETRAGDTPRPPAWPEGWAYGVCHVCEQSIEGAPA